MTEVQQFLQECKDRGKKSMSDHLTLSGHTRDYNKRKSMEFQAVRAITTDTKYIPLLGSVIFPSPNTRAAWASGIQAVPDECPKISFETSVALEKTMDPILAKNDWRFDATETAMRAAMRTIATSSNRKQEVVATGFVRQHDELDYWREKFEMVNKENAELKQREAWLQGQNATLLDMLQQRGGGGDGVVPRGPK